MSDFCDYDGAFACLLFRLTFQGDDGPTVHDCATAHLRTLPRQNELCFKAPVGCEVRVLDIEHTPADERHDAVVTLGPFEPLHDTVVGSYFIGTPEEEKEIVERVREWSGGDTPEKPAPTCSAIRDLKKKDETK